jgi:pyruvate ferredoxin oxidoreductase alpha subunit
VGVAAIRVFRPFPEAELRAAIGDAAQVLVMDRDIGYGTTGMVYPDIVRSLYSVPRRPRVLNFIIGTGGKDIAPRGVERCVELAGEDHGDKTVFWPDARGPVEGIPWTAASEGA